MNKNINWLNHLIELIVVFIGITAAFSLENWSEERKDRELEEKYITSLISDLKQDTLNTKQLIDLYNENIQSLKKLDKIISIKNYDKDTAFINSIRMLTFDYFSPSKTTFDALVFSGDMKVISDFNIKNNLSELYSTFEYVKHFDEMETTYTQTYIIPYYWNNTDMKKASILKRDFFDDKEFSNLTIGYGNIINQKIRALNLCYAKTKNTLTMLEEFYEANF